MKIFVLSLILGAFLLWLLPARSLASMGDTTGAGCPDVKASAVPGFDQEVGPTTTCQGHIELFGATLVVLAVDCPTSIFTFPAHNACLGEPSEGNDCQVVGQAVVLKQVCRCHNTILFEGAVSLPACTCSVPRRVGHIDTAQTFACRE